MKLAIYTQSYHILAVYPSIGAIAIILMATALILPAYMDIQEI